MPTEDEFGIATGATIDDYLVSIAEGVTQAQQRLNELQGGATGGQPGLQYHIPRLDFELRMTLDLHKQPARPSIATAGSSAPARLPLYKTLRVQAVRSSAQSSLASVIKGSFVAVPANGGRPEPLLAVHLDPVSDAEDAPADADLVEVEALLTNTVGEHLGGQEVQLNIDRDLSRALNAEHGLSGTVQEGTFLRDAVLSTDAEGEARTQLVVSHAEPPGASVALTVDAAGVTRTVIYRVPER